MLFNTCDCRPGSSGLSRRGIICGAGAGFVSALVGTLAGSGRTARAQALGSRVPEVDRLAVTIVTDTQIIKFIPTEKRSDLIIERRPAGNVSQMLHRALNCSPNGGSPCTPNHGAGANSATF